MLRQAQQPQGSAVLPSTSSGTAEGAQGPRGEGEQGPRRGRDLSDGQKKRPGVLNLGPLMIITVLRVCPFPSASKDFLWYKVVIGLVFHG